MKPFTSTTIKPLLSATLLVFLFEGCMHGSLPMNMDVEEYSTSSDDPRSYLPAVFRNFVELIEGERAESDIATFLNKHSQSLNTVYTWEEEDNHKYEYSCLHVAAEAGRLDVVEHMVEKEKFLVDIKTSKGVTPLMLAARSGSLTVVEYLVGKGADVNAKNSEGSGVIHYAAGNDDDPEPLKFLIGKKAPVDARDDFGFTILNVAAQDNLGDIAKYIVQEDWGKKLIETEDTKCNTPLHVAAYFGSEDVAKVLLDAGAKDVKNKSQKLASQLAMPCFPDVQQLILLDYPASNAVSAN